MADKKYSRYLCVYRVCFAHGAYLFFSEALVSRLWHATSVAGADVDFVLQHVFYVGTGDNKLWHSYKAQHAELVGPCHCRRPVVNENVGSFLVAFNGKYTVIFFRTN